MSQLKVEIGQDRPFSSPQEEALLNIVRSADCLQRALQLLLRPFGITGTQFNVLRILRGAQPDGLTCSAIGERMLTAEPDITRLLSRLKTQGLITQRKDRRDRRVVQTRIAPRGLRLLEELDPLTIEAPKRMLASLSAEEIQSLTSMLERIRADCPGQPAGVRNTPEISLADCCPLGKRIEGTK